MHFPSNGRLTGVYSLNSTVHWTTPPTVGTRRVQPTYKIDASLVNPLAFLPEFSQEVMPGGDLKTDDDGHPLPKAEEISNLAYRNLLRGVSMGLPSGQTVARYMGLNPIPDEELKVGKANVDGLKKNKAFSISARASRQCPAVVLHPCRGPACLGAGSNQEAGQR